MMRLPACALALVVVTSAAARADAPNPATREAAQHFRRGVALYGEADYRAALVEFKRAYAIAPNPSVLFDIGQTCFQLQDYAAALGAFERYLADAGPNAVHRADAEGALEILRSRVGRLAITTSPAGCEVTVDDESIGRTPLAHPVVVSIGRRKVSAFLGGRMPVTRYIEVAAGDTVPVELALPEPNEPRPRLVEAPPPAPAPLAVAPSPRVERRGGVGLAPVIVAWVGTAVLAAGSATAGGLAIRASDDLKAARAVYPQTRADLDGKAARVSDMALAADILGAAAVVAGVTAIVLTALHHSAPRATAWIHAAPGGLRASF